MDAAVSHRTDALTWPVGLRMAGLLSALMNAIYQPAPIIRIGEQHTRPSGGGGVYQFPMLGKQIHIVWVCLACY